MTDITFDIRQGGGLVPFVGGVEFIPTRTNYTATNVVLPNPQTIGLHDGKGTMTGVTPTPAGATPAWAYKVNLVDRNTDQIKSWIVSVPNTATVSFNDLPRPVEVTNPTIDVDRLADVVDAAVTNLTVDPATGDVKTTNALGQTQIVGNAKGPKGDPGGQGPAGSGVLTTTTTPPVVAGQMWLNPNTGTTSAGIDIGPGPAVNMIVDPRFRVIPADSATSATLTSPLPTPLPAVKVGSYNVFGAGVGGEKTPWATRKTESAAQITASGATLIGLQECSINVRDQAAELAAVLGGAWKSGQGKTPGALSNAFLWDSVTWALDTEVATYELPDGGDIPRTVVFGAFRHIASGVRIWFASAHLSTSPKEVNRNQLTTVARIAQDLRNSTGMEVLVAGDWAYKHDDPDLKDVMPQYGLTGMKVKGSPTLTRGDWNTFTNWDHTMTGRTGGSWIDQVYVTSGVTVDAAEVVATFAAGTALPLRTPMPSDHQMVAATVRVLTGMPVALQGSVTTAATCGAGAAQRRDPTWAVKGGASVMIDPKSSTGTATCLYPVGQSDSLTRVSWEPGKTYTVSATAHLEAAQTGTLDSQARRIVIGWAVPPAATNFNGASSPALPNTAGSTERLSVTFTVPAGATQCFIRLMNGSRVEPIWWDGVQITEGTFSYPRFDGDSPGCRWDLRPHFSTSTYPGPSWVSLDK